MVIGIREAIIFVELAIKGHSVGDISLVESRENDSCKTVAGAKKSLGTFTEEVIHVVSNLNIVTFQSLAYPIQDWIQKITRDT